jgi:hypothetical protein
MAGHADIERKYHEGYEAGKRDADKQYDDLVRFGHLCIRIGIRDLYALEHGIIDEDEMNFLHDMMQKLIATPKIKGD